MVFLFQRESDKFNKKLHLYKVRIDLWKKINERQIIFKKVEVNVEKIIKIGKNKAKIPVAPIG